MSVERNQRSLFARFVSVLEDHEAPLASYVRLFLALLTVRLALEFVSSRRLFTLADVVHIGAWFTFVVLAFMLQLQAFSGERMSRVAKLVIVCYAIAWTAPIVDVLVSSGHAARMNYLTINTWRDALVAYVSVGGASLWRGATPGIRVEIVCLVIATANYVRLKTGNAVRALVAAISIYTVIFASGAIPALLGALVSALRLSYGQDDQSTVLLLFLLDVTLLSLVLWRHDRTLYAAALRAVPWRGVAFACAHATLGLWLGVTVYPDNLALTPTTLFWPPLCAWIVALLGLATTKTRVALPSVLLALGLALAMSGRVFFAVALIWALLTLANDEPTELSRHRRLAPLVTASIMLAAALAGFNLGGGPLIGFPPGWAVALLAANLLVSYALGNRFSKGAS